MIWRITPKLDLWDIDVYVAGDWGPKVFQQFGPSLPKNLRFLGRITDDEFAAALTNALCLLFPSRMEGFGIPMTEAMVLGCPVVASNAACMPEVGGDCVLYSDPDYTQGWVDQILRLKSDPCFRESMRDKGIERARLFSWDRIAETYLRLMAEVDEEDRAG